MSKLTFYVKKQMNDCSRKREIFTETRIFTGEFRAYTKAENRRSLMVTGYTIPNPYVSTIIVFIT